MTSPSLESWPRCPAAAAFFIRQLSAFSAANPPIEAMATRFLNGAGVKLTNLVDHWALPASAELAAELTGYGLVETPTADGDCAWEHPGARLPRVRLEPGLNAPRLALAVDSLADLAEANQLPTNGQHGDPDSGYEEARYPMPNGELAAVVRQGYRGFKPGEFSASSARALTHIRTALRQRDRSGEDVSVLRKTQQLVESIIGEIGLDRATDEFFAAERDYYLPRNRAAQWQYAQQQALGFGWANHDHHTYRSARSTFRALMQLWHTLGFLSRERFYAGAEAGWGAQVLEHPVSRIVIFSDLDIAPEELNIDFANTDLAPRDELGTIGLWCALHGDSIGMAGMHHIECEFDFERAKSNFEAAGFGVMPPFTDLQMLKQAFTQAEMWPVAPERAAALVARNAITPEQAERFITQGAAGSHLEILQRWEGFKGFNKTGVSAIIRDTDARN
ncbi:MAG TPA: hypothetical protein VKU00_04800 [Chthonomonadaceae bacterium]|nr:hypothetical protein [Chthonomonadaceae bacterium]